MITLEDNWCEEGRNCLLWFIAMGCEVEKDMDGAPVFYAWPQRGRAIKLFHDYNAGYERTWVSLGRVKVRNAKGEPFCPFSNANADYIWNLINKGLVKVNA